MIKESLSFEDLAEEWPRLRRLESELLEAQDWPIEVRKRWIGEICGEVERHFIVADMREIVFRRWGDMVPESKSLLRSSAARRRVRK